jgi:uncharacterized protein
VEIEGTATRVTIFVGESDRWHHQPLHAAMVKRLREAGAAGVTVVRGVEGFGKNSRIHMASVLRLSEDLPMVITIVDRPERVEEFMPIIDEMVAGGLVLVEDVHVRRYSDAVGRS